MSVSGAAYLWRNLQLRVLGMLLIQVKVVWLMLLFIVSFAFIWIAPHRPATRVRYLAGGFCLFGSIVFPDALRYSSRWFVVGMYISAFLIVALSLVLDLIGRGPQQSATFGKHIAFTEATLHEVVWSTMLIVGFRPFMRMFGFDKLGLALARRLFGGGTQPTSSRPAKRHRTCCASINDEATRAEGGRFLLIYGHVEQGEREEEAGEGPEEEVDILSVRCVSVQ